MCLEAQVSALVDSYKPDASSWMFNLSAMTRVANSLPGRTRKRALDFITRSDPPHWKPLLEAIPAMNSMLGACIPLEGFYAMSKCTITGAKETDKDIHVRIELLYEVLMWLNPLCLYVPGLPPLKVMQ